MKFAVFASGYGGNLQALIDAVKRKKLKAQLAFVFSDKPESMALTRARKAKIPSLFLDPKGYAGREEFDWAVLKSLKERSIDFIVLAGYMRLLSKDFIDAYKNKILNIHPSLLPAFKGTSAIRDAFDYGVKVTGVTVHLVTLDMDSGPILAQSAVSVMPKDTRATLEARIHKAEHLLYPKIVDLFARGKLPH